MGGYNAWVRKHLISWMERHGLPPEAVAAFSARWSKLEHLDKLLCPQCFAQDGTERSIGSLASQNNIESLVCPYCRTQFDIHKD